MIDPIRPTSHSLRRDRQNGKIFGVCAGLADYSGIDALWIRLAFVLGTVFGFGSLLLAYIVIALLAD